MAVLTVVKISLQALAVVCLLTGIAITFVGMFTSRWQVADFGPELVHEHGLWKDCQNSETQNVKTTGDWLCFFKFDKSIRDEKHMMKGN